MRRLNLDVRQQFPVLAILAVLLAACPTQTYGEPPAAASDAAGDASAEPGDLWMRLAEDEDGNPIGMQTAVVRYVGTAGKDGPQVVVDLIGAVHVGDAKYYYQLNELFEQYDKLLYELVAPKGTVIEPGQEASSRHALGAIQVGMKNMLELEHQLEKIDYTKDNFVHADMSPEEFFQSMKDRDESFLKLYFHVVGESLAHQSNVAGDTGEIDMFKALFAKPENRARQLKIAMAKQMTTFGDMFANLGGEQGTTLINERNRAAFDVLRQQLDDGQRSIGVFYGAGHLADMDKRLKNDFKLKPQSVKWLTAWDLSE